MNVFHSKNLQVERLDLNFTTKIGSLTTQLLQQYDRL